MKKSKEGVAVYVMVWSEKTSGEVIGEKGVMGTHDMETFNFFKPTKVHCGLCPRELEVNEFTDLLQNEFAWSTMIVSWYIRNILHLLSTKTAAATRITYLLNSV